MANFNNESKLSKIMARAIVAPKDRAYFLPLATPIYCPDYRGVTAGKVTIIKPDPITSTVTVNGVERELRRQFGGTATATDSYVQDVEFTVDKTQSNFLSQDFLNSVNFDAILKDGFSVTINMARYGNQGDRILFGKLNSKYGFKINRGGEVVTLSVDSQSVDISVPSGSSGSETFTVTYNPANDEFTLSTSYSGATATLSATAKGQMSTNATDYSVALDNTGSIADVSFMPYQVNRTVPATYTITGANNTIDIDMTDHIDITYNVPYDCDLESDVDFMNMAASDAAIRFKKAVSNKIQTILEAMVTAGTIPTIDHGTTLAETFGKTIADNITNGTGQRFSIYRYDNGAPVEFIKGSNQPDIADTILKADKQPEVVDIPSTEYTTIDATYVPSFYYCEKPTFLLPSTTYEEYQTALVSGTIKSYVERVLNVDTTSGVMTAIGEGVFGTNDSFAVAFTQPKIVVSPNQQSYSYDVNVTIYFGVELIHTNNLRVISGGS